MTLDNFKAIIDYYVSVSGGDMSLYVSIAATVISLSAGGLSIYSFYKQHSQSDYEYLAGVWNELLDICISHPRFLDITITEHYFRLMFYEEALQYDVYCYGSTDYRVESES